MEKSVVHVFFVSANIYEKGTKNEIKYKKASHCDHYVAKSETMAKDQGLIRSVKKES
jgi:hypothetical protein